MAMASKELGIFGRELMEEAYRDTSVSNSLDDVVRRFGNWHWFAAGVCAGRRDRKLQFDDDQRPVFAFGASTGHPERHAE